MTNSGNANHYRKARKQLVLTRDDECALVEDNLRPIGQPALDICIGQSVCRTVISMETEARLLAQMDAETMSANMA